MNNQPTIMLKATPEEKKINYNRNKEMPQRKKNKTRLFPIYLGIDVQSSLENIIIKHILIALNEFDNFDDNIQIKRDKDEISKLLEGKNKGSLM